MRVSRLMLVTLRDIPADAEIVSHQLLLKGGYIRRVSPGIYAYLPLMWRVLDKISTIVQEEMNATGALQTLLPHEVVTTSLFVKAASEILGSGVRPIDTVTSALDDVVYRYESELLAMAPLS